MGKAKTVALHAEHGDLSSSIRELDIKPCIVALHAEHGDLS